MALRLVAVQRSTDMEQLLREIRAALAAELYLVALMSALTVPDICGALGSDKGWSSGPTTKLWITKHMPIYAPDAERLWNFRCSLLHQGSGQKRPGAPRVAFVEPGQGAVIHQVTTIDSAGFETIWYDVPTFVSDVTAAAERWLELYGETNVVQRNLARFVRRRPEGLAPHVGGVTVYA
jgi:hypothetical protein